jgi:hypothetical protein
MGAVVSKLPDLRDHLQSFGSLAASSWPIPFNMTLSNLQGDPVQSEVVWGAVVSGNYFTTLGVPVVLGRTFVAEEDSVPDARPVMIVSHRLWQTKLAANRQVIGQTLRLNAGHSRSLASPPEMPQTEPLFTADVWVPMMMQASHARPGAQTSQVAAKRGCRVWSACPELRPKREPSSTPGHSVCNRPTRTRTDI